MSLMGLAGERLSYLTPAPHPSSGRPFARCLALLVLSIGASGAVQAQSFPVISFTIGGTTNPYAPISGQGPFVCDPLQFIATTSPASGLVWDFGNPESNDNVVASGSGQPVVHQYSGLTTPAALPTTRTVRATNTSDASFTLVSITLSKPTQRYTIPGPGYFFNASSGPPPPVAGDQFVDSSDGRVESHYVQWTIDSVQQKVRPGVPVAAGGCGNHALSVSAHYVPYDPVTFQPSNSSEYVTTIGVAYSVRPFTVDIGSPIGGSSTVTFPGIARMASDVSVFVSMSPQWTVQWTLRDSSGNILVLLTSANAAGTVPSFTLNKSALQPGDQLSLTVTMSSADLSGPCQPFNSMTASMGMRAPTITPPPALSRTAGSQDNSAVTVASVSDADEFAGNLFVTAVSPPPGITIGTISNNSGTITATVNAACTAPVGANMVTLQVQDSTGFTATAILIVNVAANPPPALSTYANVSDATGTVDVTPSAAPSDNGTVNLTVASSPAFTSGTTLAVSSSTGTVSIRSAKSGTYTITVTATDNCGATATRSFTLTVTPFGAPANLVATASPISSTTVVVTWNAVADATGYLIERRVQAGAICPSPSCINLLVGPSPYIDAPVAANTAFLYTARGVQFMNGVILQTSPPSNADLATTVIFTDNPLIPGSTSVKDIHVTELRTAINAVRAFNGAGAYPFTDPALSNQRIKAVHVTELRTVLNAARSLLGLPLITYTNPLTPQSSVIKALDWTEIRNGVK